jgi:uncharacterized metal-binding protein YceD (DUF177 family)
VRDGQRLDLVADDAERRAIAERLGLESLARLEAHVVLSRTGEVIRVKGRLAASLDQSCVVTADPVAASVDEPFEIMFMPPPETAGPDEEIELAPSECDVVFHDGAAIDLGSAVADTLALSLDPYPRSAGAEAALRESRVMTEEQANPFAVLAKLRRSDET